MNKNPRFSVNRRARGATLIAALTACSIALFMTFTAIAGAEVLTSSTFTHATPGPLPAVGVDNSPGGHGDYHIKVDFKTNPGEPELYSELHDANYEKTSRIAGDFPAGMIANPGAIPYKDRCPRAVFEKMWGNPGNGASDGNTQQFPKCPESSRIGTATVSTLTDVIGIGLWFPFDFTSDNGAWQVNDPQVQNPVYLLQTPNDVPAEVGVPFLVNAIAEPVYSVTRISPIMSGPDKGRLRWSTDALPEVVVQASTNPRTRRELIIDKFEMIVWGRLPKGDESIKDPIKCPMNESPPERIYDDIGWQFTTPECRTGNAFLTNPTSPGPWSSHFFAAALRSNGNADSDPLGSGVNEFVKLNDAFINPDPSPTPALTATADAVYSTSERSASPALDVTVSNPGYASLNAADRGVDVPRKITAVLPDAVNVDVNEIGRLCREDEFNARDCPEDSKVGSVRIATPLLRQGLWGDAVLVRQPPGSTTNLPRLGLIVYGDVPFNILSSTRYVGNGTQIETTFDDIPQIGFSNMRLHIDGGAHGLLKTDRCQAGGKDLNDGGSTQFTISGYTGQSKTVSSQPFVPANCFSSNVTVKKISKCVKSNGILKVSPSYASRAAVKSAKLSVGRLSATSKKSPFNPKLKLKKLGKGKTYKFKLVVAFKPQGGKSVKSVTRTNKFTTCR